MAKKKQIKIELAQLKPIQIINNNGQLKGLPKNPRLIKDEKFEDLKKSISECEVMTAIREVVVTPYNEHYIVIAGNQRFKAMEELKFKTIPCKIVPKGTPPKVMREIAIKDNQHSGADDWKILKDDWDKEEYEAWGLESEKEKEEQIEGTVEFSEFLGESNNYVIISFDNDLDWLSAQTHFKLKTVLAKRSNGKPWSKGVGRVINGGEYLKRLKDGK